MFSFQIKSVDLIFEFSFFAIICLVSMFDGTGCIILGLSACLLHEAGHIIAMCICDVAPLKIRFYCAGIKITPSSMPYSFAKELFVQSSGIILNLLLFFSLYFSSHIYNIRLFAVINLVIALFNLLPFRQFDGGKIIDLIMLSDTTKKRFAIRNIIRITAITLLAILGILFFIFQKGNISLYISIIYIIISEFFL